MRFTYFIILNILFFLNCTQNKDKQDSALDQLIKLSAISLASSSSKCQINSTNNSAYFESGKVPTGGTSTVIRTSATSGTVSIDIYYPSTGSSFPILVLFQGGNVHSSFYSNYAARLASDGYVVYVGNRCDIFIAQYFLYPPASLGNKVLTLATAQNQDTQSPLYGKINTSKIGFLGHSLGGVVGIYAINNICEFPFCDSGYSFLSSVKAGVFYGSGLGGSFNKSKFYTNSTTGKGIPTGYIQGLNDGANKPATGKVSYDNAIATKVYFTLEGANHYGITDSNNPFGANAESNSSALAQSDAISKIASLSLIFLNAYIKESSSDLSKITSTNTGITGATVESQQ